MSFDNIPSELKERKQWVVWKLEVVNDKLTKVPYRVDAPGIRASSNNPKTWTTFANVAFAIENERIYSGIGFVFSKEDQYVGIDFDKCIEKDTGLVYPSIEQDILSLGSYTEISQSGTGIHVIARGKNPDPEGRGLKKGNFEMYSQGRYFAITGTPYRNFPTEISDVDDALLSTLYKKHSGIAPAPTKPKTFDALKARGSLYLGDEEILSICEKAHNSSKFTKLWHGNTIGYSSQSEAELALCTIFAFYTRDASQLQRLLRNSGLYRSKMDRDDYITMTIQKSLGLVSETYNPKAQMQKRWLNRRLIVGGDSFG